MSLGCIPQLVSCWTAMELMASRMITLHAADEEISSHRDLFSVFGSDAVRANIDEYSDHNIEFRKDILDLRRCSLLRELAENLLILMRLIRGRTIVDSECGDRSIIDHMDVIEVLEVRGTELADRLAREHILNLVQPVESVN